MTMTMAMVKARRDRGCGGGKWRAAATATAVAVVMIGCFGNITSLSKYVLVVIFSASSQARHSRCTQVIGGEVLGGGITVLPELAAIAAEIYAGNQHTHANPPEQLLAGQLSFAFVANLSFVNSNMRSSCSSGSMWTNAAIGDMSAKSGLPGAILSLDGPFWYH